MISDIKTVFSFNFELQDPIAGKVTYTLTQIAPNEHEALLGLRRNLAVIIQDVNERLPKTEPPKTK